MHMLRDAERPDGPCDQHVPCGRLPGLARKLDAAVVERGYLCPQPQVLELMPIRTKGVRLDDLRAGVDVSLMDAEHDLWLGDVQLLKAALRARRIIQHGAHATVRHQDAGPQPPLEVRDLHIRTSLYGR